MANQSQTVCHSRSYTRNDFTALRAFVQRVAPATIARLYFNDDDEGNAPTGAGVERYLRAMHDDLVQLAIDHGSSVLADHLKTSLRKHGSAKLTALTLKMVEQASTLAIAAPAADHGIGMWFKPMLAQYLKPQGIKTLRDLIALCNTRGGTWWRSVPRVGPGRAQAIVRWLRAHEDSIGVRIEPDVDLNEPLRARDQDIVTIGDDPRVLVPLEYMAVRRELSGYAGVNRSPSFCFVAATNDLEAIRSYLSQYSGNLKTQRAYTKELERFLLWAVCERRKALSSLLVDDCEAYKRFLTAPPPSFVGPKTSRGSTRWRPFVSDTLSAESQKYAVRAVRAAFTWLVDVRYLAGNPWKAVRDPVVITREAGMQVEKALSSGLWERVRMFLDAQAVAPNARQWRTARALLLLMGDSGLRREEAAGSLREMLAVSSHSLRLNPTYELKVVGKRKRERTIPVSPETVAALRAHWEDRGLEFDSLRQESTFLLSPLVIPNTRRSDAKHRSSLGSRPYSANGIGTLVTWAKVGMLEKMNGLSERDRIELFNLSPHSFRHTFGTQAAAENVSLDVIQRALGHQSMQTTSIYVQAEKRRMVQQFENFYSRNADEGKDPT